MYAVIATGGKQYKVEEGQILDVERLGEAGSLVEFEPILVVDGSTVLSTPGELAGASVTANIVEEIKGQKINGFTYKNKSNIRRRWGHRQQHARIQITGISR